MYHATRPPHCCEGVWMHIEIINHQNLCPIQDHQYNKRELENLAPNVTLRFHPSSIPDSRNKM